MDAGPHVLGEIRAVPVLVLRNKTIIRLVRRAVNPGTAAAITKICAALRCAIGNSVVETRSARDDTRMTVIGGHRSSDSI